MGKKLLFAIFFICFLLVGTACQQQDSRDIVFDNCFFIENNNIYTEVANGVEFFDFNNKIHLNNNYRYSIFKDREGLNKISTNIIDLTIGDNINYLLIEDSNQNKTLYTLNIRRLPIHTVSLYYYDSYESSYYPTHYEERNYIVEKKFYKSIQVQERDRIDLSKEKIEREGYSFLGWDYDNSEILEDTAVYGLWKANNYTVTVINGSETIKYTATYGEYLKIDIPQKPMDLNNNYSFKGCSYANKYKKEYYYFDRAGRFVSGADWQPIRYTVTKDITVTAHWGY